MPTYTYQCKKCEYAFEEQLKMAEMYVPTENPCPSCGEGNSVIKTIVSVPPTVRPDLFKGLSSDHKYAMSRLKKRHPRSNIPDY